MRKLAGCLRAMHEALSVRMFFLWDMTWGLIYFLFWISENKESEVSKDRSEGRGNEGEIFATETGCSSPSITLVVITWETCPLVAPARRSANGNGPYAWRHETTLGCDWSASLDVSGTWYLFQEGIWVSCKLFSKRVSSIKCICNYNIWTKTVMASMHRCKSADTAWEGNSDGQFVFPAS